ncbi:MAG: VOC family protein [Actinobacteria bacterium]|nr:VOC family protein [Actinomycetota bacterium]
MNVLSSRVLYRCGDFDAQRRFYEHTLGLAVAREYGAEGVVLGVVLFLGGGFLELTRASVRSPPISLWLQVPDVAAEERRLGAEGVRVVKPAELMPWGLVEYWLQDPEGNELHLVEVPEDHPLRRRT